MNPTPPAPAELRRFLQRLRDFITDERETARFNLRRTWGQPLRTRVATGRAVAGVRVAEVLPDGRLLLSCAQNRSRFREGDLLRLSRGDPAARPYVELVLEQDDDTSLLVSVEDTETNIGELRRLPDGWSLDESYRDLSAFYLEALDDAATSEVGRQAVLPLLMGRAPAGADLAAGEQALHLARRAGLNEAQQEALAGAYAADLAYLIQGPPGTGKTLLLAHLARLLCLRGERVLVTALTHRAINNALNTVARVAPNLAVAKIGQAGRASDLVGVESFEALDDSALADAGDAAYVVGATPFATRTRRLAGAQFDTVLCDEASQVTLPLAVMAMLAGKKFVFIGDHRQLPPVFVARHADGAAAASVFAALQGGGFETMLTETYRLNRELAAWPSQAFYHGRLTSARGAADARLDLAGAPPDLAPLLNPAHPKVFVDLGPRQTTTSCVQEATLVARLVRTLLDRGLPPAELGVVAPYRAQGRLIRRRLAEVVAHRATRRAVVADTVERMQGQEREVVIVSLTTSQVSFAERLAHFFFQPERLNVTITRPRTKLIVLGSAALAQARPGDPLHADWVRLFQLFLDSCQRVTLGPRG